jgi:hypothetical protein
LSFSKVLKRSLDNVKGSPIENDVYRGDFKLYSHETSVEWRNTEASWPMMPLPTKLIVARFKVLDSLSNTDEPIIQISSSKTSTGYGLKAVQVELIVEELIGFSGLETTGAISNEDTVKLLTRALLGLDGTDLLGSTGGTDAQAKSIIAYVEKLSSIYDIDGDGEVNPLVDTVLLYCYIKGTLKAEDLENLLNDNSTRQTLTEIEDAIQRLLALQ